MAYYLEAIVSFPGVFSTNPNIGNCCTYVADIRDMRPLTQGEEIACSAIKEERVKDGNEYNALAQLQKMWAKVEEDK